MNSHSHRRERRESFTLGPAMKSSADTTNTPATRLSATTKCGRLEVRFAYVSRFTGTARSIISSRLIGRAPAAQMPPLVDFLVHVVNMARRLM